MATKRKPTKRKLTRREQALRRAVKEEMQKEGRLPPDKPRLNRKAFAKECAALFEGLHSPDIWNLNLHYLFMAIAYLAPVGKVIQPRKITPEQVGVLKVIRLAHDLKEYEDGKRAQGLTSYPVSELYDLVKHVEDL